MLSRTSPSAWLNPAIKPLPFDFAKANQMLDSLGYKKGSDGIRVVPATTGKYAQPAHKMEYEVIVPDSLDFNGDRQFQIVKEGLNDRRESRSRAAATRGRVCDRDRDQCDGQDEHRVHEVRLRHCGTGPSTSTRTPSSPT